MKAIEGGWGNGKFLGYRVSENQKPQYQNGIVLETENLKEETFIGYEISINDALLDPLFWQCLGKQQGWGMWKSPEINASVIEEDYWGESTPLWKYHWHRFIDHIAEGGTADGFFADLIK